MTHISRMPLISVHKCRILWLKACLAEAAVKDTLTCIPYQNAEPRIQKLCQCLVQLKVAAYNRVLYYIPWCWIYRQVKNPFFGARLVMSLVHGESSHAFIAVSCKHKPQLGSRWSSCLTILTWFSLKQYQRSFECDRKKINNCANPIQWNAQFNILIFTEDKCLDLIGCSWQKPHPSFSPPVYYEYVYLYRERACSWGGVDFWQKMWFIEEIIFSVTFLLQNRIRADMFYML